MHRGLRTCVVVSLCLSAASTFSADLDRVRLGVHNDLKVPASLTFSYTFVQFPHGKPATNAELAEMQRRMEAEGVPPAVIEDTLLRRRQPPKAPAETRGEFHVTNSGGTVALSKSSTTRSIGEITDIANGELLCTVFNGRAGRFVDIERADGFASPNTFGNALLPWIVGAFSLESLFVPSAPTFSSSRNSASQKFTSQANRSHVTTASWNDEGVVTSISVTYGSATEPSTLVEFQEWSTADGYPVPKRVILTDRHADGEIAVSLSLELIRAEFGEQVSIANLETFGVAGMTVTDCRFGNDNCVVYDTPSRPFSDEQVLNMLDRKRGGTSSQAAQDFDWTKIILSSMGFALIIGAGWLWLRQGR